MSPIVEEISYSVRIDVIIGTILTCVFLSLFILLCVGNIEDKIESTCQPIDQPEIRSIN